MEDDSDNIHRKLREQTVLIDHAIEETRRDGIVDMSTIEKEVFRICARINALPPEKAETLEPVMAEIIGRLEMLAVELYEFQKRAGIGPANDDHH